MIVQPLRVLVALVNKDLRVFVTDRYGLLLSYIAPIFLASFMAVIFGGAGPSKQNAIIIKIVDDDQSITSREITDKIGAEELLASEVLDLNAATAAVREGRAALAVVIPSGFGDTAADAMLGEGKAPELLFIHDPTRPSELSLARGLLTRIILETVAAEAMDPPEANHAAMGDDLLMPARLDVAPNDEAEFLGLVLGGPITEAATADRDEFALAFPGLVDLFNPSPRRGAAAHLDPQVEPASLPRPAKKAAFAVPYTSRDQSITGGGADGERAALAAHAFASMVVQFVLFSAVEWGVCLLNERKKGLWKRLRSAPVSRFTLLLAKAIGCAIMSLSIIAVVLTFGSICFGYSVRGNLLALSLLALAFAAMASTLGLFIAAVGRSAQGARSVSILAVLVMVLLGGGWIPSFLFPQWLQKLTPAIPTRWAIDGFDAVISRGFTLAETAPTILVITAFAAGFGLLGLVSSRWSTD